MACPPRSGKRHRRRRDLNPARGNRRPVAPSPRHAHGKPPADAFVVGQVQKAHGIRGETSVRPLTDNEERFAPGSQLISTQGPPRLSVAAVRAHKGALLVKFEEITTRTEAESLRGAWLSVSEERIPVLDPGTFWIHDIIGSQVFTEQGRHLGRVRHVMQTGANDVFEVEAAPSLKGHGPILLPATAEVIRRVDIEKRTVQVRLLPGLIPDLE